MQTKTATLITSIEHSKGLTFFFAPFNQRTWITATWSGSMLREAYNMVCPSNLAWDVRWIWWLFVDCFSPKHEDISRQGTLLITWVVFLYLHSQNFSHFFFLAIRDSGTVLFLFRIQQIVCVGDDGERKCWMKVIVKNVDAQWQA